MSLLMKVISRVYISRFLYVIIRAMEKLIAHETDERKKKISVGCVKDIFGGGLTKNAVNGYRILNQS